MSTSMSSTTNTTTGTTATGTTATGTTATGTTATGTTATGTTVSGTTASATDTSRVRDVATRWFAAMASGDVETALGLLDDDIEWINYRPVPGYNTDMPWIGTYRGRDAVAGTFRVFGDLVQVRSERLLRLLVDGDEAAGIIHEISTVKRTGMDFEIEFIQRLTIRDGKIVRWQSYTDPSTIIRALRGDRTEDGSGGGGP